MQSVHTMTQHNIKHRLTSPMVVSLLSLSFCSKSKMRLKCTYYASLSSPVHVLVVCQSTFSLLVHRFNIIINLMDHY